MVVVFLADGFEEVEATAPIDIMRRAGIEVEVVGIGSEYITGSHGITIKADVVDSKFVLSKRAELIFLPGGYPGVTNLSKSQVVKNTLLKAKEIGLFITAICAAPIILFENGILNGKQATIYPTMKNELPKEIYSEDAVCNCGNIITARSVGVSMEFALLLVEKICGKDKSDTIKKSIYMLEKGKI